MPGCPAHCTKFGSGAAKHECNMEQTIRNRSARILKSSMCYLQQIHRRRISLNLLAFTGKQPATFAQCIRGVVASDYVYHQIPQVQIKAELGKEIRAREKARISYTAASVISPRGGAEAAKPQKSVRSCSVK